MIVLPCYIMDTSSWGVHIQWIVGYEPELHLVIIFINGILNQVQN